MEIKRNDYIKTIKSIKYVKTPAPEGGSGAYSSIPDKYHIVYDDGTETDTNINIWHKPVEELLKLYLFGINERHRLSLHSEMITNVVECFEEWVDEIVENGLCPYSKEDIMTYYKDSLDAMIACNKQRRNFLLKWKDKDNE